MSEVDYPRMYSGEEYERLRLEAAANYKRALEAGLLEYNDVSRKAGMLRQVLKKVFDIDKDAIFRHETIKQFLVRIERCSVVWDYHKNDHVLIDRYFIPRWMMDIVHTLQDFNYESGRYTELWNNACAAFKAGLDGNYDEVNKYLGMYELEKEYQSDQECPNQLGHGLSRFQKVGGGR